MRRRHQSQSQQPPQSKRGALRHEKRSKCWEQVINKSYQPGHLLLVPPGTPFSGEYADGSDIFRELADTVAHLSEPDGGSNSWLLTADRTTTGAPLMAGDPHRGLDVPNVYYQNHVTCPDFDVIGMSFPGCPGFPHFGHNARVAWCVTHAMADYQDLYIECFNPENSLM